MAKHEHECDHLRLHFGSGNYYIFCRDCPASWVHRGSTTFADGSPVQAQTDAAVSDAASSRHLPGDRAASADAPADPPREWLTSDELSAAAKRSEAEGDREFHVAGRPPPAPVATVGEGLTARAALQRILEMEATCEDAREGLLSVWEIARKALAAPAPETETAGRKGC